MVLLANARTGERIQHQPDLLVHEILQPEILVQEESPNCLRFRARGCSDSCSTHTAGWACWEPAADSRSSTEMAGCRIERGRTSTRGGKYTGLQRNPRRRKRAALQPGRRAADIVRIDQAHRGAPGRGRLAGGRRLTLQPTDEIARDHRIAGPRVPSKVPPSVPSFGIPSGTGYKEAILPDKFWCGSRKAAAARHSVLGKDATCRTTRRCPCRPG